MPLLTSQAKALIWTTDSNELTVKKYEIELSVEHTIVDNGWTIVIDDFLLNRVISQRSNRLPNETGGVLVGSYDLCRKIVYVVTTIPSPQDSIEKPEMYIRGMDSLKPTLKHISTITASNLKYIGEWHSHPPKSSCKQSQYDSELFSIMQIWMKTEGLPTLMLIVGDDNYKFYIA